MQIKDTLPLKKDRHSQSFYLDYKKRSICLKLKFFLFTNKSTLWYKCLTHNQQAVLDLTTPFIRSKDGYDFVPEGTLFKEVSDFD